MLLRFHQEKTWGTSLDRTNRKKNTGLWGTKRLERMEARGVSIQKETHVVVTERSALSSDPSSHSKCIDGNILQEVRSQPKKGRTGSKERNHETRLGITAHGEGGRKKEGEKDRRSDFSSVL